MLCTRLKNSLPRLRYLPHYVMGKLEVLSSILMIYYRRKKKMKRGSLKAIFAKINVLLNENTSGRRLIEISPFHQKKKKKKKGIVFIHDSAKK